MSPNAFDLDVAENAGYRYTTNAPLSSQMAYQRLTEVTLAVSSLKGKRVIDVGCGDGTSTAQMLEVGRPAELLGFDVAAEGIRIASERFGELPGLEFKVGSIFDTAEIAGGRWDLAVVRGVLHHVDDASGALREVGRVADEIVVIEPNGYNPVLKVIEKVSRYHREHEEKSYPPRSLRRWVREAGYRVSETTYAGQVPFFCPDPLARVLKRVEPLAERSPTAPLTCAVHVVYGRRN